MSEEGRNPRRPRGRGTTSPKGGSGTEEREGGIESEIRSIKKSGRSNDKIIEWLIGFETRQQVSERIRVGRNTRNGNVGRWELFV